MTIDDGRCLSVKSRNELDIQCPNKRKYGNFCGIHNKVVINNGKVLRIDRLPDERHRILINLTFRKPNIDKKNLESIDKNCETMRCSRSESRLESPYYDNLELLDNIPLDKLNYAKIIKTLRHYQVQIRGPSRSQLVELLKKTIREVKLLEEAYEDPMGKCNNQADFYDFVELNKIPQEYLFVFMCHDGMLYGMDLRSMYTYFQELEKDAKMMEKAVEYRNPYNRCLMSSKTICSYRTRIKELLEHGKDVKYPDESHNPEDEMTFKVLEVFHTIYNYGYAVDASWFLKMTRQDLLDWYWTMEDVWNRRLGLNISTKRNIVPQDIHIFNKAEYYSMRESGLLELQKLMIEKIDAMVNSGIDRDSRILGIHYVLIGLTEICEVETATS